jgi:putative transcriptional regulator
LFYVLQKSGGNATFLLVGLVREVRSGREAGCGAGVSARSHKPVVSEIAHARMVSGLSQSAFAALLGVSVRTLQDWEQGRRKPSGAAKTLIKVAELHPEALQELAA